MPPSPTRMDRSRSRRISPYPQVPPPPSPPPFLRGRFAGNSYAPAPRPQYPPLPRRRPYPVALPRPPSPPVLTSAPHSSHTYGQGTRICSSSSSFPAVAAFSFASSSSATSPFGDQLNVLSESSSSTSAGQRAGETCPGRLAPESQSADVLLQLLHRAREELDTAKRELALQIKGKRELSEDLDVTKDELKAVKGELTLVQGEHAKYAKSVKEVREETSCGICSHQMTSSVLLECGHSFCSSCVYAWFKTRLKEHQREYPQYNPRAFIPEEWIVALQDEDLPWLVRFTIIARVDAALLQAAHPHYTCPTCRRRIKSTPIPNVALKQVIRCLDECLGEESYENGPAYSASIWEDLSPFNIRELELR